MLIKFFQKDIISGSSAKVGDKFTARFFGEVAEFIVQQISGVSIFAVLA
jgi:hypothetical protein